MAQKTNANDGYKTIDMAIKENRIGSFYIFHGEEHYLRDHYIQTLRNQLCPDGLRGFNHKRFSGKDINIDILAEAVDSLPVFAKRTFIEIHDYDIFYKKKEEGETNTKTKASARKHKASKDSPDNSQKNEPPPLFSILSSLPEYVCLLFVYDTIAYKPDGRIKANKEVLQHAQVIEFSIQDQNNLVKWLAGHYRSIGKKIGKTEAEHLIHITGGYMSTLKNEVDKTAAFAKGEYITRADIDAVVIPALDAVVYQLSDALIKREHAKAIRILDELLRMREAPQKLIYNISLKMRQLLAARVCIENKLGKSALMEMCALNYSFQAQMLLDTAHRSTLEACRRAVLDCAQAAYDLNSAPDPESRMVELVLRMQNEVNYH